MTTTEAPFVNVLMLPNWGQYPLDPIRAVFYEGTLYILTQDIDNALQKPGHGHTLTGIPKEHRRRFTIHRTAKRNGERSNKFTAVTTTALQTRFESMRGLHPQLKENMLSWIKTIASGGLLKIATWHQPTATGWENHKVEVKKNRHRIHTPRRMGRRLHHMRLLPRIPKPPRSARVRNSARRKSCIPRRSRRK